MQSLHRKIWNQLEEVSLLLSTALIRTEDMASKQEIIRMKVARRLQSKYPVRIDISMKAQTFLVFM